MNKLSDDFYDSLSCFIGKNIRVITDNNHYRGLCEKIDGKHMNVLLKDVLEKRNNDWVNISNLMLIRGGIIESIYLERSFPFDDDESLILAVEEGRIVNNNEQSEE